MTYRTATVMKRDVQPRYDQIINLLRGRKVRIRIFVLMLAAAAAACFAVLHFQQNIAFVLREETGHTRLNLSAMPEESRRLMKNTGALSVAVWSVDFESNQRRAVYIQAGNRRLRDNEGSTAPVMRPFTAITRGIIELTGNPISCWKHVPVSDLGWAVQDADVKWVCAVALPPDRGIMTGMLVAGFGDQPKDDRDIQVQLRTSAEKIIR